MSVRAGREFLAIPGPTTMPDEVLRAMHRPALDIYSDQMIAMTDSLLRDLSKLFSTKVIRCWCWKAAGLRSAGAMPRPRWAPMSRC
jgi:aspartate aminotransferase-like enzyme